MIPVKPKKSLGQHFLMDKNIARKIVSGLSLQEYNAILEVGPGMGILTEFLEEIRDKDIRYIEIDNSSVDYLKEKFPLIGDRIIQSDMLKLNLETIFHSSFAIIGNFPYNISSQLFFSVLKHRNLVKEVVCMIQKEVADRIASPPGSKVFGILSVFLQTFYRIEYLFTVNPTVFNPPPKVQSAVIRLTRNNRIKLECNEDLYFRVVKTAFNQRRKTMRNSLKSIISELNLDDALLQLRPEQIGVDAFIRLTQLIENAT